MTIHSCRDLVIGGTGGFATGSLDTMWAASIFLQGVCNHVFESTAGAIAPPAYADLVITYYSATLGTPNTFAAISSSIVSMYSASCSLSGSGSTTLLQFSTDMVNLMSAAYPVGYPQVSGAWPGVVQDPFVAKNWVALRSAQFPLANSGIFFISDAVSFLSANCIAIDYRTTSPTQNELTYAISASFWTPPGGSNQYAGALSTGNWPFNSPPAWAPNGGTHYRGNDGSTYPRQILRSPSPLGWRVRLSIETPNDTVFGGQVFSGNGPDFMCIPGITTGSGGDFLPRTFATNEVQHLHVPQWFNYTAAGAPVYTGGLPGVDPFRNTNAGNGGGNPIRYRFYAWGDDVTGTCGVFVRNILNASDAFCMFGQAENEVVPLPSNPTARLFVVGLQQNNQGVDWRGGTYLTDGIGGVSFSLDPRKGPISCVFSTYAYAAFQTSNGPPGGNSDNGGSIRFDKNGPITPFMTGSIELLPVEIIAGTWDNWYNLGTFQDILPMEPRLLGRAPLGARFGSSITMPSWGTADTARQWFHITNGFFMPWGGLIGL